MKIEKMHVSEKDLNKNIMFKLIIDPLICSGTRRWLMTILVKLGVRVGGYRGVEVSDKDKALFMDEYDGLNDYSDEQLLWSLMTRRASSPTPRKTTRYTKHYSSIIGIGDDYSAEIVIDSESYKALIGFNL